MPLWVEGVGVQSSPDLALAVNDILSTWWCISVHLVMFFFFFFFKRTNSRSRENTKQYFFLLMTGSMCALHFFWMSYLQFVGATDVSGSCPCWTLFQEMVDKIPKTSNGESERERKALERQHHKSSYASKRQYHNNCTAHLHHISHDSSSGHVWCHLRREWSSR